MLTLSPQPDQIISSPYYRCLQTLRPGVRALQREKGYKAGVILESGFEEWYGETGDHREQPGPCDYGRLKETFFPEMDLRYSPLREGDEKNTRRGDGVIRPNKFGESIEGLHNRVAYALHTTVERADREGWRSIVICMHAAVMIAIGRALTGRMPEDYTEEDFQCFTASMSTYQRRRPYRSAQEVGNIAMWDPSRQGEVPEVPWRRNGGVMGGWDCLKNADTSFLANGEERGWHFSGDESFLRDPNGYNDKELDANGLRPDSGGPNEETSEEKDENDLNLNRALCTVVALAEDEMGEKVMEEIRGGGRSKL